MRAALEKASVVFFEVNGGGPGVRLKGAGHAEPPKHAKAKPKPKTAKKARKRKGRS